MEQMFRGLKRNDLHDEGGVLMKVELSQFGDTVYGFLREAVA